MHTDQIVITLSARSACLAVFQGIPELLDSMVYKNVMEDQRIQRLDRLDDGWLQRTRVLGHF